MCAQAVLQGTASPRSGPSQSEAPGLTRETGTALLRWQCCSVDPSEVPSWTQRDEHRAPGTLSHPQPLWVGHTFG